MQCQLDIPAIANCLNCLTSSANDAKTVVFLSRKENIFCNLWPPKWTWAFVVYSNILRMNFNPFFLIICNGLLTWLMRTKKKGKTKIGIMKRLCSFGSFSFCNYDYAIIRIEYFGTNEWNQVCAVHFVVFVNDNDKNQHLIASKTKAKL